MKSLNHMFRTIWSEALGAWIAVSEITKTKGKRSASNLVRAIQVESFVAGSDHGARLKPILFAVACCFAFNAQANPVGGAVVNGQASFNTSGNTLTVTNTPGTIINWQGFSINANEVTRFAQQSAASTVLNRVVTNNPSVILGTLSSNGQVYLVNANGIMFGAGSTVDVAGLVATSLNLSNADFLAGRHNYTAVPGAQNVSNAGNITAQQGGQVYLIAPNVENSGIITAPNGEILLAAGNSVQLVNSLDPNLRVSITAPAGNATNLGKLIVESGSLGLFGTMVKNSGTVSADSAVAQGGKIVFKASQNTEVSGTVSATGTTGGNIEILGNQVALLANANVDASGVNGGGTVLVGGDAHGANPNVQNAQFTYVDAAATIKADAVQNGNGGKVVVWSDNATQFSGNISARGGALSGNGGWVETSGKQWLGFSGLVDTRATNGLVGSLLLDPTDITISTAADSSLTWNGTSYSGTLATGNLNVITLQTQLGLTNVTVDTNSTAPSLGNITVANAFSWNSANSLTLNAVGTGSITTNAGATITNTGTGGLTMTAAAGSITLNGGVTLAGGAFTANAAGATSDVLINAAVGTGTGAINLTAGRAITEGAGGALSTTGLLTTSSVAGATLNGANTVVSLAATNSTSGNFSFNDTAPGTWLYVNGITNTGGGTISVTNAGVISIGGGISTTAGGAVNLTTTGTSGWIRQIGPAGIITTTGTLTTNNSSASGTSLNSGTPNMVGTFNATDVGFVFLNNGTALNVSGITASDVLINNTAATSISGAVTASNGVSMTAVGISNNSTITGNLGVSLNAGTGTLSNATATSIITNGGGASTGAISLTADKMALTSGTVTAGAGAVSINNSTLTDAINLGSTTDAAASTLELSSAELATISTTGLVSIGNASNSGAITVSAPLTLTTNTVVANSTGGIAINGAITATGKNLTLNTTGVATQTAAITAAGLELLGTGSYTLTNAANSIATIAGNTGSVSLTDSIALSVGTVNTVGLTATGAISLTSTGAISQSAAISTPGLLTTSSAAGTTLSSTNSLGALTNSGGLLSVTGGATTVTGAFSSPTVNVSAGTLNLNGGGTGAITIGAAGTLNTFGALGGPLVNNGNATFAVSSGAYTGAYSGIGALTLNVNGGAFSFAPTFVGGYVFPSITYINLGNLNFDVNATIANLNLQGSSFRGAGAITIPSLGTLTAGATTLGGTSTLTISQGATANFSTTAIYRPVTNLGTLNVNFNSTISTVPSAAGPNNGSLTNGATGVLNLNSAWLDPRNGGSFVNNPGGQVVAQSGYNMIDATGLFFSPTQVGTITNNGSIAVNAGATLVMIDGFASTNSGTYTNAVGGTLTFNKAAGAPAAATYTYTNANALTNNGTASVTGTNMGNITNTGALTLSAAAVNGTLANNGTGTVTTAGTSTVSGAITNASTAVNGFNVATGTTLVAPSFTNTGNLAGGGTLNLGTGTLSNNGTIAPGGVGTAGTFTIVGNLVMGATGTVNLDLISPSPGNFDVLNVSGTATLTGGTLKIAGGVGAYTVLNATGGLGGTTFTTINAGAFTATPTYAATFLALDMTVGTPTILTAPPITPPLLSELVYATTDIDNKHKLLAALDVLSAANMNLQSGAPILVCQ